MSRMLDLWWRTHDSLLHICERKAQELLDAITAAVSRVIKQDNRALNSANHETIRKKYQMLNTCQDYAHEAQYFCARMLVSSKAYGKISPFDTQPAERSEYAWIPRKEGKTPVSPMRAVWQLERTLDNTLEDVAKV